VSAVCPDLTTCAQNCALEGADEEYTETYGITAQGDSLDLHFVTKGPYSTNVGSRTYLMDTEDKYMMFKLKNKEFTFDVDVSSLPCGLNGALYFVQMDEDGGKGKYPSNDAGAKYGTGYCDAQCPHDLKYINGEPNMLEWQPSSTDPNSGQGKYGTCCVEVDIWEANSISQAFTAHSCSVAEQTRCEGVQCGDNPDHRFDGTCDKNGCDFQPYRLGNSSFFGAGSTFGLDTTQKMTVVTQFVTDDGTDRGELVEIRRFYQQNGKRIQTPTLPVGGSGSYDALSDGFCDAWRNYTGDGTTFLERGGFDSIGDASDKGMVLVMSIWDDHDVNMLWLDATYPTDGKQPGAPRGTCSIDSGDPKDVEASSPDSHVTFSNIRFGEIGSTVSGGPSPAVSGGHSPAVSGGPSPAVSDGPSPGLSLPSPDCPDSSMSACISLCPNIGQHLMPEYRKCVDTCQVRCSTELRSSFLAAGKQDGSCHHWGVCAHDACCPTGWTCTEHGTDTTFKQCMPKPALALAFFKTKPDAAAIAAFLANGTTVFAASGLPHEIPH